MEALKDPVSVRVARLNAEFTRLPKNVNKTSLLNRETILDALQVLYEECNNENLQKTDSNIAEFVKKFKNAIKEVRALRVNICDFEIKNIIGCGHFGEVHVVKEKQTNDIYAMKTIRKFDNSTKKTSFEEERNIMAFSNSPWLTSLQYSFQDSSYLFYIMDYHPGGDLLGLLHRKGGSLPESAALFYIAELILALDDLHNMGYVHRDIKPDNILLDRCGHLKLADFGSAAKLDKDKLVKAGPPVGTPDYIAPEVLQCLDNNNPGYGISCDFWSLGVLAYELTIGHPPFQGQNSTAIYSKIMNFPSNLKFPSDLVLSQGFVSFIKALITDVKTRLKPEKIKSHSLFKETNFNTLRDQVPPYVPKILSIEDTSNFTDIQAKKKHLSIENFKRRSQFSGRNLPFVGFTFTPDPQVMFEPNLQRQNNELVNSLKSEVENLKMEKSKNEDFSKDKESVEKKLEQTSIKLQGLEALRDKLEKQVAESMAESAAVKRTLEIERKERSNLEKKALDLIKGAKLKWELAEKSKIGALDLEIKQLKAKIDQMTHTNQMLDEQLLHVRKMEERNRQSLETEKSLGRRSVVGLENLLEKVNNERQIRISELQIKLNEEQSQKSDLEFKIQSLEKSLEQKDIAFNKSQEKLKSNQIEHDDLKNRLQNNEVFIKELNDKVNELEYELIRIDEYESEIESLRHKFEDSQKTIKDLQNKIVSLQQDSNNLDHHKQECENLKKNMLEMQTNFNILEKKLEQEKEDSKTLKKRLEEAESAETKTQELREKNLQFYKMQKELSDCKIDKRILERELKEAKMEIKQHQEKLADFEKVLAESKSCHEKALLELSHMNENVYTELVRSKENIKNLQEQLQNEKGKNCDEKSIINEMKSLLAAKDNGIQNLEHTIRDLQNQNVTISKRCENEEKAKANMAEAFEVVQKDKAKLLDKIEELNTNVSQLTVNRDALREACILLESQVKEYENLVEISKTKQSELSGNTEKLIADLCQARSETQEARRQINEQKSLKAVAEQKNKRLQEDIDCLTKECTDYKSQCMEYKQFSHGLSEELTGVEEKLSNSEVTLKSYERKIEKLSSENRILKEEISDHLTNISHLRDSKYRLSHQVDDLKKNVASLVARIHELESTLQEKMNYFREREVKAESRDQQHLKLIDYLQSKIEEQSHKKKSFTEVIFGSSKKENQPPISLALNYKDLETELIKEKESNKKLKEEVVKLKAATMSEIYTDKVSKMEKSKVDVLTPNSKAALSQIVVSPTSRQNSSRRMHYSIPHRLEKEINTKTSKCPKCGVVIPIGTIQQACKECKIACHTYCADWLPKTCGIPKGFIDHYKETVKDSENAAMNEKKEIQESVFEGWIKVPCTKSNSWEKRYARLTETSLDIYTQNPKENITLAALESFPLKPEGTRGNVILEPTHSEIGLPVANSDLPFIMKVEVTPETTCWPSKCVIFMALSAKEKDSWFSALQKHFATEPLGSKLETLMKLPEGLSVNCLVELTNNIRVLGTDQGLYSYYENNLLRIEGVSKVEQIIQFSPANAVLMIAGPKSSLISCDVNHLINLSQCASCTKPTLKYKDITVNNLNGFHILQVSKQKKLGIATVKQVIILDYFYETNEFIPIRILDTAKPTSCLLFTENSLIVGADKFFEIDLKSFQGEEFLDASDINLKQVLKCYKIGSFPLNILEVSNKPKEYLLSFNEFSIFVDEYGRSSRQKEIKNEHLPLSMHLLKNYLYIIQFGAIEILKITQDTCNNSTELDKYRMELNQFKYLGANSRGIFIKQNGEVKFLNVRNLPDFDAVSLVSESTEQENESNHSQFSFTSSMVQSLDGNLSDSGSEQDLRRKVKFDQTDF
ncbi:unnamed protein product [Ceutorhynchus assimilis]|uniref:non-specific serine/threonine protein kinase n=1 Tax=Ceutorhynchus assimilis TaxID=467358 RepID=A0A9N9MSA8_9CUCU|nr:unnamed protein product [Ceutorhynchus assimilis]